jgi:two-component system sensor histidine kinase/response regulator
MVEMVDTYESLVLIVDDAPQNLHMLNAILKAEGYQVAAARSGQQALQVLGRLRPDLILLDVMMDGIDGYETCRQIRANADTADIPIIFLTARDESGDVLQGFEAGAVDYITKPYNGPELLARVRTHTMLQRTRKALQNHVLALQQLNAEKTEFLSIASHDLKNPLGIVAGAAEMLLANPSRPEDVEDYAHLIHSSSQRMLAIVSNLLDINRLEQGRLSTHPRSIMLAQVLDAVIEGNMIAADRKNIQLEVLLPPAIELETDPSLLQQIIDNLLSNAIKYSPPHRAIQLQVEAYEEALEVRIRDQGPGISRADQARLFQKFVRLSARPTGGEHSNGLGLYIAHRLAGLLGGELRCESNAGQGATFVLALPYTAAVVAIHE